MSVAGAAMAAPAAAGAAANTGTEDLKLGVASYSFREFSRAYTIRAMKQLNVTNINIKEFHLPYISPDADIEKAKGDFAKAGLHVLGGGNISLAKNDEAYLRFHFEYARKAGFPLIVCAPTAETLPTVEKLVKEFNIKAAVHNHGPEDKHFPTPQSVLKLVKNMDPRVGLCIDVGHTTRTGVDVVESIAEAGPRLLDMHIKDLKNLMDKDSQVPVGDGAMPVVAIFKQLKKMNYQGAVMLEYEVQADNPLPGMQKSFSYMRGVLAGLHG